MSSAGIEKRGSAATVKACDSCRRRKRRCVWAPGADGCTPCMQVKEDCTTTHIRRPRAKSQKRNRIAEYENRIQRLEALLEERTASQPHVEEQPIAPADSSKPLSQWVSDLRDRIETIPFEEQSAMDSSNVNSSLDDFDLDFDFDGNDLFVPTSTDSNLAQVGLDGLNTDLANAHINVPLAGIQDTFPQTVDPPPVYVSTRKVDFAGKSPFVTRTRCDGYMPHPELGASLLTEYLVDFNQAIPLFRPYEVANHLRVCYSHQSDGSALAWANTYVVFGIAHRLRAMSAVASPQDNNIADDYSRKVLSNISDLLLTPPSLPLIQCLLGLAILLSTTSHSHPHALFVATALRMAQTLAYNDDQAQEAHADNDVEQQRRVFWLAFLMDSEISMIQCGPTTACRDDISAEFPEESSSDSAGAVISAEGNWRINLFSIRTQLSLIQAEAIERVLSVKGRARPRQQIVDDTHNILAKLKAWRTQEIFRLSTQQVEQLLYRSDIVHIVIAEGSYFATLFRLHTFLALGLDIRLNSFAPEGISAVAGLKTHASYKDARRLLSLLVAAPMGDLAVCWMTKNPVVAALVTVLSHTYHNAFIDDAPTREDLQSYGRILDMLTTLAQKGQDTELQQVRDICMALLRKVEGAQNGGSVDVQAFPVAEEPIF